MHDSLIIEVRINEYPTPIRSALQPGGNHRLGAGLRTRGHGHYSLGCARPGEQCSGKRFRALR